MALSPRRGLSLIEVVAAIALLAGLLTGLLLAWTRHRERIEVAQQRLQAAEYLDEQLAFWFADDGRLPFPAAGPLADTSFVWQTYRSPNGRAAIGGLIPVTVEVLAGGSRRLLSIEVVAAVQPGRRPEQSP